LGLLSQNAAVAGIVYVAEANVRCVSANVPEILSVPFVSVRNPVAVGAHAQHGEAARRDLEHVRSMTCPC
jgi:hypothetical protein